MRQSNSEQCRIEGTVTSGFESVRELFENNMRTFAEENAQLCVYHKGERVVDLWGAATGDDSFTADSLINVFSSGKSLEAIAIAWLVGNGHVSYDAKIIEYWPEFGAHGKESLTVADLMRHEAGLAALDKTLELEDLRTENIKRNLVGRVIEENPARFPRAEGIKRDYHALSRGWIANELFRRTDPRGRTIGEFLREDISEPLQADAIIGVTEYELPRLSKVKPLGFAYQFLQSLKPRLLGRKIVHNIFQILGRILRIIPALRKGTGFRAPTPIRGLKNFEFFNEPGMAMGETPSATASCTARGLAKIGAMMSGGGKFEGAEYLPEPAWKALHACPTEAKMGGFLPSNFTQGGVNQFEASTAQSTALDRDFNDGREGFYGWMGLGGSIFQWHPGLDIGFGFVPTSLHVLDFLNERGKTLQAEVLKCAERLEAAEATRGD